MTDPAHKFLELVREMLSRPDFLIPLAAAQRQYRADNYQMGSAAQLEDLFFDAMGTFLRENRPREIFRRRNGKEAWDYEFFGVPISHKEGTSTTFTAFWESGIQTPTGWLPKRPTHTFDHHIVMIMTGFAGETTWTSPDLVTTEGSPKPLTGRVSNLGSQAVRGTRYSSGDRTLLLAKKVGMTLEVVHTWPASDWTELPFLELWPDVGGDDLLEKDMWVDRVYQGRRGFASLPATPSLPCRLELASDPLQPGVYLLHRDNLVDVPMVANNKAHSVSVEDGQRFLLAARENGLFVPMPLWFGHFADTTPPNLYSVQRRQYESLFAARRRDLLA